jgi:heme oxygenase
MHRLKVWSFFVRRLHVSVISETSSLGARLKEHTRVQHQHAERRRLERDLMAGKLPRETYVTMLGQRYLIHKALEPLLISWSEGDPAREQLIQKGWLQEANLRADLGYFGIDPDSIEPVAATAALVRSIVGAAGKSRLLGYHYVFEGSKNGARYVAKSVRGAYRLEGANGTRYLDPHGEHQHGFWQQFKQSLDALILSPQEEQDVIEAAAETFDRVAQIDDELYSG